VELSAVVSLVESAEPDVLAFDFDLEAPAVEASASFEPVDCVESAAASDFLAFDLGLGFGLVVLESV